MTSGDIPLDDAPEDEEGLSTLYRRRGATFDLLPSASPASRDLADRLRRIAATDLSVLLLAETGSGKTLYAQVVHNGSRRAAGPFIAFNGAGLSESLAASELFGHEKGAFTGAVARHVGRFERASGGTLFLDEIGDLPLPVQGQILHAIEYREYERVGGSEVLFADVRVVAATNHDLDRRVAEGRFRQDLLFRLRQAAFRIPPLRERIGDLPELLRGFARDAGRRHGRRVRGITGPALAALNAYAWPGNVRELRDAVTFAVAMAPGDEIRLEDLPEHVRSASRPRGTFVTLEEHEQRYVAEVLAAAGGNKSEAARILGITRKTLYEKLRRHGLVSGDEPDPA